MIPHNTNAIDTPNRVRQIVGRLRAAGYRVGPSRKAILQALVDSDSHPAAEEIFDTASITQPRISLATVYKTLEVLRDLGEVLELEFRDDLITSNRYDGKRAFSHPHLVCQDCGSIEDLFVEMLNAELRGAAAEFGFDVERYRMDLYGRCVACQQLN